MKRWVFTLLIILVLAVVLIVAGYQQISIDALQEPGPLETILATRVKHLHDHANPGPRLEKGPMTP
jgi:hypothetical protein